LEAVYEEDEEEYKESAADANIEDNGYPKD
jgi:hypothetical protein